MPSTITEYFLITDIYIYMEPPFLSLSDQLAKQAAVYYLFSDGENTD